MANLFQPSLNRALDDNGNTVPGAKMYFFLTGTTTPATWFTNQAGTVAGTNPLTADAGGKFATPAYLDPDTTYRVRLTDADGVNVWPDVDPVRGYDEGMVQTAAEGAAASATTATTQAGIATTQAGLAATARTGAETAETNAETAQGLAEDARDASEDFRDEAEAQADIATTAATTGALRVQNNPATPTTPPSGASDGQQYWAIDADATYLTLYLNTSGTGAKVQVSGVDIEKPLKPALDAVLEAVAPTTIYVPRTLAGTDLRSHLYIEVDSPDLMVTQIPIPSNSEEALAIGAAFVGTNTGTGLLQFVSDAAGDAVITPAKAGYLYVPPGGSFRVEQRSTDEWVLSGDLSNEANAFTAKLFFDPSADAAAFQERTGASASTAAGDGDVMGTLVNKGTAGGYAVSRADVRRPTRQIDDDGFWCFVTDGDATAANADFLEIQGVEIDLAKLNLYVGFKALSYGYADGIIALAPVNTQGDVGNDRFAISQNALNPFASAYAFNMGASPNRLSVGMQSVQPERPHVFEWRKVANDVPATITIDGFEVTHNGIISQPALANTTALVSATVRMVIGANAGNDVPAGGAIQHSNTAFYGVIATDTVLNTTQRASIRAYLESKTYAAGPVYPDWADLTELEAARTVLQTEVFGGAMPTDLATLATDASPPVTGLTNLASVQKMTIPGEADTNIKPRLWTPNSPRTDVVALIWAGHAAGWNANGIKDQALQPLLTAGVPCVTHVLPDGANDFTSGAPSTHDANATPYDEWARQAVVAVNTLLDQYPGAEVLMTGISGGGWATMLCAALDPRITKSVQFVGTMPETHYLNGDFEQWLTEITANYLELYLMAAADGRRHIQVLHETDVAGLNRYTYDSRPPYAEGMADLAADFGGYFELRWFNYSLHALNADSTTTLLAELP